MFELSNHRWQMNKKWNEPNKGVSQETKSKAFINHSGAADRLGKWKFCRNICSTVVQS